MNGEITRLKMELFIMSSSAAANLEAKKFNIHFLKEIILQDLGRNLYLCQDSKGCCQLRIK
jgi:hypothetical protein